MLVVGAGGIGCELLKGLALSGFRRLVVLDLDTIDASNLNRQFLFRPQHVGKPKAVVARDAVLALCPGADIVAHHACVAPRGGGAAGSRAQFSASPTAPSRVPRRCLPPPATSRSRALASPL